MNPPSSRDRFDQMLSRSATAAICADPDNRIVSWNTAAEALFGHAAVQVIGRPLSIIIPERFRASHEAGLARAVRSGQARLAGQAVEILALHADGNELPVELSLSMWLEDGKPMFGALVRDVTDRARAMRRLEHLAHCDTLTSLPNRNAMQARLQAAIAEGPVALLMLDLDGFKHVNDTLGHSIGDRLLAQVAKRLTDAAEGDEFLARIGGDEFAIVVPSCQDPCRLDGLAERIFGALSQPFELAAQSVFVDASIGIAFAPQDARDGEELLAHADLALYSAKAKGGGARTFFMRAMQTSAERRLRLSMDMRGALAREEFELWYQPQVRVGDGAVAGVEALLRWRHPDHGLLLPAIFVEALERSPASAEVGDWIIQEACKTAASWQSAGLPPVRVGVNLFAGQLYSERLFDVVTTALDAHGLSPSLLELEITENTVLQHNTNSTKALRRLKLLGVQVAFDDFGTGFASLSLLQKYPLTCLKIDRSFIARIDRRAGDAAIVGAIITMAQQLGLQVIAEGVETAAQEEVLRQLRCDEAQGYRYGRPMPGHELLRMFGTSYASTGG
ncbi:EAL domain-containing protein [Sphingomonas sp. A2-49]|uniref:putative bifunctional diguanylate cyclase/phosphodiesterase n=1 Tax=Sphingomonas sp. A2-49 TaxID=1391375 RepID=UPI0021D3607A|nr:EAL domain-containing protein [Sphingomonas sp. A2-49]MCU6456128.1 EAL domain-containing protein [Sphingomonas sp. A2-49]